jgi:RND family efflux transporter MFP subunit
MKMLNVVLTAAAASLAAGCTVAQGDDARPPRPVKVQAVVMATAPAGVRYSATIEPLQQVTLAFKASGYVDDLVRRRGADGIMRVAQAGDHVARGTVLGRVRETDYRERVNQGRARLADSEASLKKANLDLTRAETLFASESLTKPDLDAARAAFESAQARVAAANSDLELAISALGDCELIAPAAGVILERRIEVGTLAGAGTVAFVMGDVSSVKARFGIPDAMIDSVTPGAPMAVTVDAVAGATFPGRVTAVAPAADPQSRVFDVEVTIPNAASKLRPGMIGTVALGRAPASEARQPLIVPLGAVVNAPDSAAQYAVLVVERQGDADVAKVRPVELGDVMGNGVAVVSGVSAGDRVVVSGASLLIDSERVRVIP